MKLEWENTNMMRISSCAALAALMALFATSVQAEPLELTAMTYNVRYGTADDGENHWRHRKDIFIRSIEAYDPDIIGTQETLVFQADYIQEQLPEYRWLGIGRDKNGQGEYCAIVYRWREYIPLESKTFWLSETPDVPGSRSWDASLHRIVTYAKFHHWRSGTIFHLYNTHFDHRGVEARLKSAQLLADYVEKHHDDDYPVVVLGDFNARAEIDEPYTVFIDRGFRDAWTEAPETVGPPVTWSAFRDPIPDSNRRIDWILYRGPVTASKCETILYNEDGRYPSDHYPVQAWLSIGAPVQDEP